MGPEGIGASCVDGDEFNAFPGPKKPRNMAAETEWPKGVKMVKYFPDSSREAASPESGDTLTIQRLKHAKAMPCHMMVSDPSHRLRRATAALRSMKLTSRTGESSPKRCSLPENSQAGTAMPSAPRVGISHTKKTAARR